MNKKAAALIAVMVSVAIVFYLLGAARTDASEESRASFFLEATGGVEKIVFQKVNAERAKNGLAPLAWSEELAEKARAHSASMAEQRVLSHDGFEERVTSVSMPFRGAAENVAKVWSPEGKKDEEVADDAVSQWMGSEGHRTNILGPYSYSGVGVRYNEEEGFYYFTQIFYS
ncbi:MAG: CAP domain-containing protein [archaeon]